jgi:hypothetical protein
MKMGGDFQRAHFHRSEQTTNNSRRSICKMNVYIPNKEIICGPDVPVLNKNLLMLSESF